MCFIDQSSPLQFIDCSQLIMYYIITATGHLSQNNNKGCCCLFGEFGDVMKYLGIMAVAVYFASIKIKKSNTSNWLASKSNNFLPHSLMYLLCLSCFPRS